MSKNTGFLAFAAVVIALLIGVNGRVTSTGYRGLLQDQSVESQLQQAFAQQDPSKVQAVAPQLQTQQQAAQNTIASSIQQDPGQAQKVASTLENVQNVQPTDPGLASQLPTTAQQLEATTGVTQQQLQQVAQTVAGQQGAQAVTTAPQQTEPAVQNLLSTLGGGNVTGNATGAGRRLQQQRAAPAAETGPNPILELYRKALATAICANPNSAAGALGQGIVSNNNNVALATLQGLADASNQCCDKAAQAADAGYKIAQQNGKGDIYIFRLLFAIFKLGLQFCAIPPSFFLRR